MCVHVCVCVCMCMRVCVCAGIVKRHSLGYQECDVVQAVFDKNLCTSQLKVASRFVSTASGSVLVGSGEYGVLSCLNYAVFSDF